MPKKSKINQQNLANIASDAISDMMHSVLTDLVTRIMDEGLVTDVERLIQTVDEVTSSIGVDGIRLRRANVERRNVARRKAKGTSTKGSGSSAGSGTSATITWIAHPKDKKLEYTKSIEIGKKYILRKTGTNKVVGLLDKSKVDDKKSGYGLKDSAVGVVNSAEMLMLKARGFELDKKIKARKQETSSEEEDSEEEVSEEESVDEEDSEEESESEQEVPVKHRRKRCVESMPIDREITMKDLLVALDKINTTMVQMLVARTAA
ncbi:hypothetical protein BGZ89_005722 [Linnemannia elongata]|nr:hypothetical protein BGZ89_005722 [Linnemannia elongata]